MSFISLPEAGYCRILAPNGDGAEAAIEAIETQMEFVGLAEHFDESLALFRNWIGRPDFDLRYQRMNVSDQRGEHERKFFALRNEIARLVCATKALAARSDIAERIAEARHDDVALFEHVRTHTFERMRRLYGAGPGPFAFEDAAMPIDSPVGHAYRSVIARPLISLLVRRAPDPLAKTVDART